MNPKNPNKENRQTWFQTGVLKAGGLRVDRDQHALRGVTLCNEGEAKGHGMWLDGIFTASVADGVKSKPNGLKSRLSHPSMCNDGTGAFLGKVKPAAPAGKASFRGSAAPSDGPQRYDLFISSAAEEAPGKGDIRAWVEEMAEKHPDMIGFSIVFRRDWEAEDDFAVANGGVFKWSRIDKNERTTGTAKSREEIPDGADYYVDDEGFTSPDPANISNLPHARLKALHAADIVDDPAATDGLFGQFSTAALADRMTEYLDLHPDIFKALQDPAVVKLLAQYADRLQPFLEKYQAQKAEETTMSEDPVPTTPAETPKPVIPAAAVPALAAPAAAVPAAVPPPAVPDALAVANARITELEAANKTKDDALAAEQAKVAALSKGEEPVSASAGTGKPAPKNFWDK